MLKREIKKIDIEDIHKHTRELEITMAIEHVVNKVNEIVDLLSQQEEGKK